MNKSSLRTKKLRREVALFLVSLLFGTVTGCHFRLADAKKTKTEPGPFQPYGGRREITFNTDTSIVEMKEYDANGNLRRRRIGYTDKKHRLTFAREEVLDDKNNLVSGHEMTKFYRGESDLEGKHFTSATSRKRRSSY